MVNKVNGQKYYEYAKINRQKREMTSSSEFHMNLDKQGVIYEHDQEKKGVSEAKKEETLDAGGKREQIGGKLQISRQGQEQAVKERQKDAIASQLQKFAETAVAFFKSLWDKIWNDHPKEPEFPQVLADRMEETMEQEPKDHPLKERDSLAWSIYTQEEIREIFRRGDPREIEDFLSEHGERHLAKNSDLLTQYDKRGSIVGIDSSDKEKILHGTRNEIGL